jgi:site-specific DNA-methyltransferase (adenine-specific)
MIDLLLGDCLVRLKELEDNSIDSIVTDPPYGLSFMGKKWDYDVPSVEIWKECLRVLKPGGHLLSFSSARTYHRMVVNVEDAGFEIRDQIMWIYASGFPKSQNVGKAYDKKMGNEREVVAKKETKDFSHHKGSMMGKETTVDNKTQTTTITETKGTSEWEGCGTALKPAHEPIVLARKPLSEKTIVENCIKHGTGALDIDGCRVPVDGNDDPKNWHSNRTKQNKQGRFPANLIHDGSDEVVSKFPNTKGWTSQKHNTFNPYGGSSLHASQTERDGFHVGYNDDGSAARFFYCAKTSKKDRGEGNSHPTVKPTKLMQYLVRLVTPPDGICLDPFMGSGSTGKACKIEHFNFIGIELNEEYYEIAKARIEGAPNTLF